MKMTFSNDANVEIYVETEKSGFHHVYLLSYPKLYGIACTLFFPVHPTKIANPARATVCTNGKLKFPQIRLEYLTCSLTALDRCYSF
jgi:hypothetical protein